MEGSEKNYYDIFMQGVFIVMQEFKFKFEYVMETPATRYLAYLNYLIEKAETEKKTIDKAMRS